MSTVSNRVQRYVESDYAPGISAHGHGNKARAAAIHSGRTRDVKPALSQSSATMISDAQASGAASKSWWQTPGEYTLARLRDKPAIVTVPGKQ